MAFGILGLFARRPAAELTDGKVSPKRKLIVLHTPKCGGTSLFASLNGAFGSSQIYRDYRQGGDEKVASVDEITRPIIYGHFRAKKYENVENATWVTLLRDPIDRMMSLYFNWRFSPINPLKNRVSSIRRDVRLGKMSLVEFAALPNMSNRMSQAFFYDFDMTRFKFIILQDNYDEGVRQFSEWLGTPLQVETKNVSSSRSKAYENARRRVMADAEAMRQLEKILAKDIAFYERCVQLPSAVRRGKKADPSSA